MLNIFMYSRYVFVAFFTMFALSMLMFLSYSTFITQDINLTSFASTSKEILTTLISSDNLYNNTIAYLIDQNLDTIDWLILATHFSKVGFYNYAYHAHYITTLELDKVTNQILDIGNNLLYYDTSQVI